MKLWILLFLIICLAIIIEWIREIHTFRVTHYQIHSEKLKHLKRERKVIVLSDLHNACYGKENKKLLDAIRQENPDLILIAGDMLIGKKDVPVDVAEAFVGKLPEICETYYGNGNHEHRMKLNTEKYGTLYADYKKRLEEKGVHFLENEKVDLMWDEQPVQIYGLEIPQSCYVKLKSVEFPLEEMEKRIGKSEQEKYEILIAHNPVYAPVYMEWGADLILSGHLHGGIIRLPYFRGLITPQMKLFPKYSGELTVEDGRAVVVSKGLGVHTVKIRLFNPAEMIVLHIK